MPAAIHCQVRGGTGPLVSRGEARTEDGAIYFPLPVDFSDVQAGTIIKLICI